MLSALLLGSLALVGQTGYSDRVFDRQSFWYTPIPRNAPLHPNSQAFVAEFLRQKKAYYGTVGINTVGFASPVYVVGKDVPTVTVTAWNSGENQPKLDAGLQEAWKAVPIPSYAEPADGTDSEMTIYQPSTDTLWEFWLMHKIDGRWRADWGGRMQHVSKSNGIWPKYYGTTATGLPFMGGQITPEEVQKGEIRHVMGIALVECESPDIVSWPAGRSDGGNSSHAPNRIAEGQRFRLDPSVDVDALNMHPVGKIIARAAQKYGFVVWDKAGAIVLRATNPKSYTLVGKKDPWEDLFKGTPLWQVLEGFPWDKLQFFPMDYGKR